MANQDRRDLLRDAAIHVLAREGGRGLTHRAVDAEAGVPGGTAKNYFPAREALLRAVAERCLELYRGAVPASPPGDPAELAARFEALLRDAAGPGRARLLAYLELQAESARRPWLAEILDPIAAGDFTGFELAQRAAGLPVTRESAALVTLALHGALPHLLSDGPDTLAAAGLDDPGAFVRGVLRAAYPGAAL
ncbi:TetR/AcrR family transcriptional regulator [Nonomuraea endophytica]|uniref:AcrR family transcriptional regulator n=1 Tax=Nonomuraea endophytica TaxID=714136 RepID=A0A7W8A4L5_9ACTN|nr:TetR family transcriptional regulator [Nonomuraea endophytica]MBB5078919.1 AcrR family transcriptional regulator [Nonomuraea endophytica]